MATEQQIDPSVGATSRVHEHGWVTESSHLTSEGVVSYVRCASCAARRVDMQARHATPPSALSEIVPG